MTPRIIKGAEHAYFVEARRTEPSEINGQRLTTQWKRLVFLDHPLNVPAWPRYKLAGFIGYYSYEAAQALRYWFLADADDFGCTKTRLVKVTIEYTHTVTEIGTLDEYPDAERADDE